MSGPTTTTASRPSPPPMRGPMAAMMGGPPAKAMDFRGSVLRLVRSMQAYRALALTAISLGVLSVALSVTGPRVLGKATDIIFAGLVGERLPAGVTKAQAIARLRATGQGRMADVLQGVDVVPGQGVDFTALAHVLMLALAIYVLASLLAWQQGRVTTLVVQRTVHAMRREVEEKFARLPLAWFDGRSRGEVLSRVTNDIDNIAQTLQQTMSQLLTALLTVVGVLTMMFVVSPLLALIALVTVPLSALVTVRIGKQAQPRFIEQWASTGRLNGHVEEMYTGHAIVKVFGRTREARETFVAENAKLYEASFRAQFISGLIQPAMFFIGNLNYVFVAVIGGLRVASGAISLGDVQAFIQYSRQFSQPLTQVASMANLLQSGVASAERVFELLDADEQSPDPSPAVVPSRVRGRVAFEDVSFRYVPDTPLIEHLDLVAEPGHTVAIVGPTGAGKTTLANLLLRFYDVDAGRITLDGVDTRDMRREELRDLFGMVLQDTWLFNGTIRENIAYGADDPTPEQVLEAATAAYVDHFVRTLPDGYDTVIDEEGAGVSAGQRQLLTIARAFLADPAILILDEATSSVDTRTEALVQRAMADLRRGRTSFVVAHRLSTIRDADHIVVMEEGQIVEQGTHQELLAAGGAYHRLYAAQFSGAVVQDEELEPAPTRVGP